MGWTFVRIVSDADLGQDPPAAAGSSATDEGVQFSAKVALRSGVGETRHWSAHDLAGDQFHPLLWRQEQIGDGVEFQCLHRIHQSQANHSGTSHVRAKRTRTPAAATLERGTTHYLPQDQREEQTLADAAPRLAQALFDFRFTLKDRLGALARHRDPDPTCVTVVIRAPRSVTRGLERFILDILVTRSTPS
jgi:hypothetical protein